MIILKAAIFAISCFILLANVSGDFSFSHTQKWPSSRESRVFIHSPVMDNTSVTWVTCDYLNKAWHTEPKCTLRRLIYHNDGTSESLSCDVNLAPKTDHVIIYGDFRVVSFGKDKAILVSTQDVPTAVMFKFSAVDFRTCNVIQNSFVLKTKHEPVYRDILNHFVAVAAYDDKYDIVHKNDEICGKKLCIMSIDADGKIIEEAHAIPIDDFGQVSSLFVVPVSPNSVSKGYVLYQRDDYVRRYNQISLTLPDGVNYLKYVNYSAQDPIPHVSMTHNMLNFCELVTDYFSSYFCAQYDQQGNLKNEMDYEFKTLKAVRGTHNLPGGGFLLFSSEVVLPEKRNVNKLIRIDSEGKVHPSTFEIEKISCKDKGYWFANVHIFEKDDKELCVALACRLNYDPIPAVPTFHFNVECVNYDTLEKVLGDIRAH